MIVDARVAACVLRIGGPLLAVVALRQHTSFVLCTRSISPILYKAVNTKYVLPSGGYIGI